MIIYAQLSHSSGWNLKKIFKILLSFLKDQTNF